MAGLKFDIIADNSNFLNALKGAEQGVRNTSNTIEQSGQSIEQTFERIKNAAGLAFTSFTAKEVIQSVAQVRGEFQQLEVAMNTMLGSKEKADQMMTEMTTLAATTPFDLKSVAGGAKQLLAYGFEAEKVSDTLRRLGDVAAGLSINLGDLTYLYGTTMAQGRLYTQDLNQFTNRGIPMIQELAKQFGVADSEVKKLVEEGKVGFPEVQKVIESLTNEGGKFGGLMEAQSHTIVGQWSNIQDSIDMALNEIGKSSEGIINAALSGTSFLVEHWEEVGTAILAAASTLGIYKASLMGMTAMNTAAKNIGYDAEIAQLQALIPVKEQEAKTDLEIAAANGTLTTEKAALIASLREEAAAHLEVLEAEAAAAQANFNLATSEAAEAALDLDAAKERVSDMEELYDAALATGDAEKIEAAETALNTAMSEENSAAKVLNTAQSKANAAATEMNATRKTADTAATQLNTAENVRNTTSTSLLTMAKLQLKVAIDAVNESFLASPLFWIAAVIVGVTYAVYRLATAESTHEQAIRESNEALDEQNKKLEDRKNKISSLIRTIQDENATEYDKIAAYNELKDLAPELTKAYTQQQLATMEAAESQKLLNENMDEAQYKEAQKAVEELTEKQKRLQDAIQAASSNGGGQGVMGMHEELDLVNEKLDIATTKLANMNIIRQQVADEARPIEIRVEEAKNNYNTKKAILDFYSEAITLTEDWQRGNEIINYATGETRLEEFIRKAKADIEDLRHKVEDNPMDVNLRMQYEQKQKILNEVLNMKSNMANSGVTTIPLFFKANFNQLMQQVNQAQKVFNYLTGQWENGGSGDNQNINDAIKRARKEKREADKAVKDAKTVGERKAALQKRDNSDKALKDLGVDPNAERKAAKNAQGAAKAAAKEKERKAKEAKQKAEQAENERIQLAKDQQRYNELVDKQALERKRKEEDLVLETEKAKTEALKEGYEKTRRTLKDTFEREKLDIERWYEDLKQKKIDSARQLFEADPKNKKSKAIFDPNSVDISYTDEETDDYNAKIDAALAKYNKGIAEVHKKQEDEILKQKAALTAYLKDYGSMQEQRLAIAEEYAQKIAKAETEGERLSLQAQRDKALQDFDFKEFKEGIDWEGIFGNLSNMTREKLEEVKGQLREMLNSKDLSIEDYKTAVDQIDKVNSAIVEQEERQHKFLGISIPINKERRKIELDIADAKERQADAAEKEKEAISKHQNSQIFLENVLSNLGIDYKSFDISKSDETLNKFDKESEDYKLLQAAIEDLAEKTIEATEATKKRTKADNNLANAKGKDTKKAAGIMGDWFGVAAEDLKNFHETADTVLANLNDLPDLLETFGVAKDSDAGMAVGSLLDGVNSGMNAFKDFESGNYVGALMNSIDAIDSFGDVLGFGDSDKNLERDLEQLAESNEILKQSLDRLSNKMDKVSVAESGSVYELQKENLKKLERNLQESMARSAAAHKKGIKGKHSSNSKIGDVMTAADWAAISKAAGRKISRSHEFWSLSAEEMRKVAEEATAEYNKLKGAANDGYRDAAQYMDEYIALADQAEEARKRYQEKLTNVSFDSIVSEFQNALMNMDSSAEDFANNFEKMMINAVIGALISNKYKGKLEAWYKKFADYSESGNELTKEEQERLRNEYKDITKEALEERNRLKDTMQWQGESEQQSGSSRGFETMTQDQASELSGRFTAIQVAGETISQNVVQMINHLAAITSFNEAKNTMVTEIRNMMITTNSYLEDMVKYAKATYKDFGEKLDKISNNTARI